MTRPCLRCHAPLVPDQGILDDARRAEITLHFVPLRCRNAHTERLPLDEPRRVRYVPTCGYCGDLVFDLSRNGNHLENHRACIPKHRTGPAPKPHQYIAVEVEA